MPDIRVQRAKIELMLTNPFFGSLTTRLELKDWDRDTFGTDGKFIMVPDLNKHFKGVTFQQLVGLMAHETSHCALGHVFRAQGKDEMLWNVASDLATNSLLTHNGFQLPPGGCVDSRFDGMTAEKIYSILMQNKSKQTCPRDLMKPGSGKGNKKDDKGGGKGKGKGKNKPENGDGDDEDGMGSQSQQIDPKEMEQEWREAVIHAAKEAKGRGHLPGGLEEYINEVLFPKVPWYSILYKHLQLSKGNSDYASYPFNRRHIWREIYLPSMNGERIDIVCAMDTSGSISKDDLVRYFSEIRGICSIFGEYKIHLFQADTEIHRYDVIEDDSDMPNIVCGRGGTSFKAVFKKVEETEELQDLPVVYFTDLDGDFPSKHVGDGVFWCIRKEQNRGHHEPPFGAIIEIDD